MGRHSRFIWKRLSGNHVRTVASTVGIQGVTETISTRFGTTQRRIRALGAGRRVVIWSALLAFGFALLVAQFPGPWVADPSTDVRAQSISGPTVRLIELDRAIDSVSERFLLREMNNASESGASAIIIRLDTPGGALDSTRVIVSEMLSSTVPIVVWVAPSGAQAASAGTFVAAAAHVWAMAPATNTGAASVVSLTGEELRETQQRKANEDAAALLRSIGTERGRDVEALEATVFEAKAYTAQEALDAGIVDIVEGDIQDLLTALAGRTVQLPDGETIMATGDGQIETSQLGMLERILTVVSNPSLAFLFISLGGIGLIVELWNFGTWIPGILGVIFLILGFAGIGQLSFEWAGIALIIVAMVLFTLELVLAPGLGIFGIAGVVVLLTGGLFLFPVWDAPDLPGAPGIVNRWMLGVIGTVMLAAVLLITREIRKDREAVPYTSPGTTDLLIGQTALVVTPLEPNGSVRIAGEVWTAESFDGVHVQAGEQVVVVAIDGVTLSVRRADDAPANDQSRAANR